MNNISMKRLLSLLLVVLSLVSCKNNGILSIVEDEINEFSKCTEYSTYHKWYYKAGYSYVDKDATYEIYKAMPDARTDDIYLNILLVDGVASYHKQEVLEEKLKEFKDYFKNNGYVISIDTDDDWIQILLRNEYHLHDS